MLVNTETALISNGLHVAWGLSVREMLTKNVLFELLFEKYLNRLVKIIFSDY